LEADVVVAPEVVAATPAEVELFRLGGSVENVISNPRFISPHRSKIPNDSRRGHLRSGSVSLRRGRRRQTSVARTVKNRNRSRVRRAKPRHSRQPNTDQHRGDPPPTTPRDSHSSGIDDLDGDGLTGGDVGVPGVWRGLDLTKVDEGGGGGLTTWDDGPVGERGATARFSDARGWKG
jgi:hypothetical protein